MKENKLTEREQEVLSYILSYYSRTGLSPSMREIAGGVYLSSVSSVHRYIHSLMEKGYLFAYRGAGGQIKAVFPVREEERHAV